MKPRLISWTVAALLLTALGLGCAGSDSNPFGSSAGGSGGGGGGTPGSVALQVLANNIPGGYNGLTLTVLPLVPGPADPVSGDPASSFLDLSLGSSGLEAQFCPFPGTAPICFSTSLYPSYANMITWTLSFDMMVTMATLANIDSVTVSWGPAQCALVYNVPQSDWNTAGFTTVTVTPSMFNNSGCSTPSVAYVNLPFGISVLRRGSAVAGDGIAIDNIKWVH